MRLGRETKPDGTKTAGYPWWPLAVLSMVNFVDQVDLSILRGVLPLIQDDFGVNDFQLGLLGFVFILVHTIAAIPSGWMADRMRRSRIIGTTLLTWSGLSVAAAASANYLQLLLARAGLGIGQAVDDPSSTALLADYYPPRLRGRVFSVQQVMTFVGSGIGIGLGGYVGETLGWRWAFLLVGTPGLIVAFLVFRLRNPKRGEALALETTGSIDGLEEKPPPLSGIGFSAFFSQAYREVVAELRSIFGIRTMRYILIGVGVLLFSVSGIGFWLTVYHERYSGMTLTQATAATGLILGGGGLLGTILGGRLADRLYGQGPRGRITMTTWAVIVTTVLFVLSYMTPVVGVRFVLQFAGVFAAAGAVPALRASMADVVPAESMGMGVSALSLVSALFGTALAPPAVGLLSDLTGSLVAAFYIVSPPILVGALILLRARTTIEQDVGAILEAVTQRAEIAQPDE